jgi:ribonuclease BN (tRNA processing enzyme)
VDAKFFGVRGSTPCSAPEQARYGGNTSCVVLSHDGLDPLILDLGTGLRFWGMTLPDDVPFKAHALVTHLHWDHIQGLPFFSPINVAGALLDVYGPCEGENLVEEVLGFMRPPYFPITLDALRGSITLNELAVETRCIGGWTVTAAEIPHVGLTYGYRIEVDGQSVAYIPDHQQPGCRSTVVAPTVLDLCRGVDVLIHDAQFNEAEFAEKFDWGHCTADYAVEVARQAEVGRLVMFHHDPARTDDQLDADAQRYARLSRELGLDEIICANEGLSLEIAAPRPIRRPSSRRVTATQPPISLTA